MKQVYKTITKELAIQCDRPATYFLMQQFLMGMGCRWNSGEVIDTDGTKYQPVVIFVDVGSPVLTFGCLEGTEEMARLGRVMLLNAT